MYLTQILPSMRRGVRMIRVITTGFPLDSQINKLLIFCPLSFFTWQELRIRLPENKVLPELPVMPFSLYLGII